jgi:dienelactone hydrolase
VLFNHGRSDSAQYHWRERALTLAEAAQKLGPVFARHGYVLLFPFRRGEGPSQDQGAFIGDLLRQEQEQRGDDARKHRQLVLLTTDHLDDGLAALTYLKAMPQVDGRHIAVIGHSFGGGLAVLEAERDPSVRAVVTFGAAAASWEGSPELRTRLLSAIDVINSPLLLIHAANDYSLAPGQTMAARRARLSKPCQLQIYPAVGASASDGHNFIYTDVPVWEGDVFAFLDARLKGRKQP